MGKQRDAVRMTEAEIETFLEGAQSLHVSTIGPDGAPHLTTVWFLVKDGEILFETYGKSQKVVNLQRDNRIAVLAEDGTTYATLRGVSINGTARVIEDNPERTDLMELLVGHHNLEMKGEGLRQIAEQMAKKRVVVAVKPDKVISWDHTKLGGKGPV